MNDKTEQCLEDVDNKKVDLKIFISHLASPYSHVAGRSCAGNKIPVTAILLSEG
jgi:hypothetical protein